MHEKANERGTSLQSVLNRNCFWLNLILVGSQRAQISAKFGGKKGNDDNSKAFSIRFEWQDAGTTDKSTQSCGAPLIRRFSGTNFRFHFERFSAAAAFPINCTGWQSPFHFLTSHFNKQTCLIVWNLPIRSIGKRRYEKNGSWSVIMTLEPVITYHYQMRQRIGGEENSRTDTVWCRQSPRKANKARHEWKTFNNGLRKDRRKYNEDNKVLEFPSSTRRNVWTLAPSRRIMREKLLHFLLMSPLFPLCAKKYPNWIASEGGDAHWRWWTGRFDTRRD